MTALSKSISTALFALIYFCHIQKCRGNELVSITLKITGAKGATFEVSSPDLVDFGLTSIAKAQIGVSGIARLEFSVSNACFALLSFEGTYIPVFLNPGDALTVHAVNKNGIWESSFFGNGAEIDRYLPKISAATNAKSKDSNDKPWFKASPERFVVMRDSLKLCYQHLLKELMKTTHLNRETEKILALKNEMALQNYEQQFYYSNVKLRDEYPALFSQIEKQILDIPFNTISLRVNIPEYGEALNRYLTKEIYASTFKHLLNKDYDSLLIETPVLAQARIKETPYPKPIADLLLAKNLYYWLRTTGITEKLDSLCQAFRTGVHDSKYVSSVDEFHKTLESNAPGKLAPEIMGTDRNGKKISLSDLRGKVVYVDVWASWCVPCREEFPNSIDLINQFKDNKEIVFLFASVDSELDTWKKLLDDSRTPSGIHLNQPPNESPENIFKAYHLSGIPNYMLIDKEGKIIQAHAPRPSSRIIVGLINKALANK